MKVVLALLAIALFGAGLDMASRAILGRDLVSLASAHRAVPAAVVGAPEDASVITTLDGGHFTVLSVASAECAEGPRCPVRVTIEPGPGRQLLPTAPYAFAPDQNVPFDFEVAGNPSATSQMRYFKFRASESTERRAVITFTARLLPQSTDVLEGKVRVVTCESEQCDSVIVPIRIALPTRREAH